MEPGRRDSIPDRSRYPDSHRAGPLLLLIAGLGIALSLGPGNLQAQPAPGHGEATDAVRQMVEAEINSDSLPYGLRIHLYNEVLHQNTVVRPYRIETDEFEPLICPHRCLLYFVDPDPIAHYGHPVIIALWDLESESMPTEDRLQWMDAKWWPVIEDPTLGPGDPVQRSVFDTVASRASIDELQYLALGPTDPEVEMGTLVYEFPAATASLDPARRVGVRITPTRIGVRPEPAPGPSPGSGCGTWATLVVGHKDINDSFDEDAAGMLTVLRGHQVPVEQIYYLSPHHGGQPDVLPTVGDHLQRTTLANIKNAVDVLIPQNIVQSGRTCDEFLFFISTHGVREKETSTGNWISTLQIGVEDPNHSGTISPATLNDWLCGIPCRKVTVVIEACNSGGFLPELSGCPTPVNPTHPPQERFVFTSTSTMGESHADDDSEGDPNPGDVGSETIGGYIEAFASSAADLTSPKGQISFGEAVQYAIDNDASIPNRSNSPQVYPPLHLRHDSVYPGAHWCYADQRSPDLDVAENLDLDEALVLATHANSHSPRSTTIENNGAAPLSVGTLRYYTPRSPQFEQLADIMLGHYGLHQGFIKLKETMEFPDHFVQVGDTRLIQGLLSQESMSFILPRVRVGPFSGLTLEPYLVVVDSPRDPVTPGTVKLAALASNDNNVGVTTTTR